jgi:hypothetical protein
VEFEGGDGWGGEVGRGMVVDVEGRHFGGLVWDETFRLIYDDCLFVS